MIPKGESPNEVGYLILQEEELKILFQLKDFPTRIKSKNSIYVDRILCILIPKFDRMVTLNNVIDCIRELKDNTFARLQDLNNEYVSNKIFSGSSKDLKYGRKRGLLSEMYINIERALKYFENNYENEKNIHTIVHGHIHSSKEWNQNSFLFSLTDFLSSNISENINIIKKEIRLNKHVYVDNMLTRDMYIVINADISKSLIDSAISNSFDQFNLPVAFDYYVGKF